MHENGVLGQLAPTAPCSDEYQLDGTWMNVPGTWGVHTTIMPAPGTTSEQMFGAFHFLTQVSITAHRALLPLMRLG